MLDDNSHNLQNELYCIFLFVLMSQDCVSLSCLFFSPCHCVCVSVGLVLCGCVCVCVTNFTNKGLRHTERWNKREREREREGEGRRERKRERWCVSTYPS